MLLGNTWWRTACRVVAGQHYLQSASRPLPYLPAQSNVLACNASVVVSELCYGVVCTLGQRVTCAQADSSGNTTQAAHVLLGTCQVSKLQDRAEVQAPGVS